MENAQTPTPRKKTILSGIQPTSTPHIGNYLGALKNWIALQDEYDCAYMIADLHAITIKNDPAKLRQQGLSLVALLLACGIDPQKSILFFQSHVPTHTQLAWVLNCFTQFGELSRMTQFKDKAEKHKGNVNAGLFTYPCLMAADILVYNADLVPVGADQKQHLELARNIAARFNGLYGDTFTLPEPYIPKTTARIMSLADPTRKMSKSDENPNACVTLTDAPEDILRKFRRAVTDSEAEVAYREGKDGVNNLISIYSAVTGKEIPAIEAEFAGRGYGDFKTAVGEAVAEHLRPIREEYTRLMADKGYLVSVYKDGAERALRRTQRLVEKVYRKVGFVKMER